MGAGTNWIPGRAGDALVMLDAANVPEYFTAIGLNTRYIIHPEEILADNFILLVRGERNVRTPKILEELKRTLASALDCPNMNRGRSPIMRKSASSWRLAVDIGAMILQWRCRNICARYSSPSRLCRRYPMHESPKQSRAR